MPSASNEGRLSACEAAERRERASTRGAEAASIQNEKLIADGSFMRRLGALRSSKALRCHAGGDDHSKVRCFARALNDAGAVRSLPTNTAQGRTGELLEWIRRAETEQSMDARFSMDTAMGDEGASELCTVDRQRSNHHFK